MRRSGRTKRMLLRAILSFLEGNDVVVTGWNYNYAYDLFSQCKDIIYALHLHDKIELDILGKITYHDKMMWFTSHMNFIEYEQANGHIQGKWEIFMDHYDTFYPPPAK